MEDIDIDEWVTPNEKNTDGNLDVSFFIHPCRNDFKSQNEGRSIYDDVEYIRIQVPGNRLSVLERPVRPEDLRRFAAKYKAWKDGNQKDTVDGTPLADVKWLSPSQKEEYAYFKVKTIEALAACADTLQMPTLQMDKRRAKAFVAAMTENAPILEVKRENAELAARLRDVESKLSGDPVEIPEKGRPEEAAVESKLSGYKKRAK